MADLWRKIDNVNIGVIRVLPGTRLEVQVQGFEGEVVVDYLDEKALPTIIVKPRADCDSESFLMTQEAK